MLISETDRLRMLHLTDEDAPFILTLLNTPTWLEFIGDRGIHDLNDAQTYIRKGPKANYEKYGFGLFLVQAKETNVSIGLCGFLQRDFLDAPDLGFALLPEYAGQGLAYEAATAVIAYVKETLHVSRILAFTTAPNQRSIGLIGRLGFSFTQTMMSQDGKDEFFVYERLL